MRYAILQLERCEPVVKYVWIRHRGRGHSQAKPSDVGIRVNLNTDTIMDGLLTCIYICFGTGAHG